MQNIMDQRLSIDQILEEDLKELKKDKKTWEELLILSQAETLEVPTSQSEGKSWRSIERAISTQSKNFSNRWWLRMAASVSIILISTLYFLLEAPPKLTFISPVGEITKVNLPDGSKVILNAESTLKFSESGWDKNRKVYLDGKAHFEVKEGSAFEVITGGLTTTVLGTSFDVDHRYNHFVVNCYYGSVKVSKDEQELVLLPGESAILESSRLSKSESNNRRIERWIFGEFHFNNEPLNDVVEELQRQFGINVVGLNDDNRIYRGYFYKDNLTEALDLVFKPMGYDYKINGDIVTLK